MVGEGGLHCSLLVQYGGELIIFLINLLGWMC